MRGLLSIPFLIPLLPALLPAQPPLVEGNAKSPVKILIFEDLQCSDCTTLRKMLDDQLLPKYKSKVAFEHRDFPLAKHEWARKAAAAARYFHTVNAETAIAWRRYALTHQPEITPETFEAKLTAWAASRKLDGNAALAALSDARFTAAVEKDFQEGVARGVSKTPTVFVNGDPYVETFSLEEISKAIDSAIKELGQ